MTPILYSKIITATGITSKDGAMKVCTRRGDWVLADHFLVATRPLKGEYHLAYFMPKQFESSCNF